MAEEYGLYYEGIGRRKAASARVRIYPGGNGTVTVNDKNGDDYFDRLGDLNEALLPLEMVGLRNNFNVTVKVNGGGVTGQSDAVKLGVARALLKMDENYRPQMRKAGLLTRDSRVKERKKPGLKGARKAPTYTKR